ncbi:MAG: TolC family protein [Candidatus Kryptoniota bacterium]
MHTIFLLFMSLFNIKTADTTYLTYADARILFEKNNQLLKAAGERIASAHADVVSSKLLPNPQISANGSFINIFTKPVDYSSTQTAIRVDQVIPIGPKRGFRINEAEHSYIKATADYNDFHNQLLFSMKELFVETAYAELEYQIAKENHRIVSNIINASKEKLKAGDIGGEEFKELSLDEIKYVNDENEAWQNLVDKTSQLKTMLGIKPSRALKVVYDFSAAIKRDTLSIPESTAVKMALDNRQDLKSLKEQVRAATYHVKVAYASIIPDLDIGLELDRQGPGFQNTIGGGLSLAIPLFNRNQDEIERANADLKTYEATLENTKLQIRNEVNSAYSNYESSLRTLKSFLPNLMNDAVTVREMSMKNYLSGNIGLVDFLQAQRIYTDAVDSYYSILLKVEKSRIELEKAIGIELSKEGF